jgi:Ca2+-binding RTX toxin-like protein
MRRSTRVSIIAAALALAGAGPAHAATVTATHDTINGPPATLTYTAAPGEANDVTITTTGAIDHSGWLVTEEGSSATLVPGAGCQSLDTHTAFCALTASDTTIAASVDLGDMDDQASLTGICGATAIGQRVTCSSVTADGGDGNDFIVGSDSAGRDKQSIEGGTGDDTLVAGAEGATMDGGDGNDKLFGSHAADLLTGGNGDDVIRGYSGNDDLRGGPGNDVLEGGYGTDQLKGAQGEDTMHGGPGNDTLRTRDGAADQVFGDSGTDEARIDRGLDPTSSIESIF